MERANICEPSTLSPTLPCPLALQARPWVTIEDTVTESMAKLVGAQRHEVVVMNSLTTNLHLLMVAFYRPTQERYKIIIEKHAFPSDTVRGGGGQGRGGGHSSHTPSCLSTCAVLPSLPFPAPCLQYAVKSQLAVHGFSPEQGLIEVGPREGEQLIREEDLLAAIEAAGSSLALVLFSGVQYYTGQLFPIQAIAAAGHAVGASVGIDLAHAVGNVPLCLHDWGVDFAAWCSYKYLNSGPGGIAGAFLHDRHADKSFSDMPFFAGWWGHSREKRFAMGPDFLPMRGAARFQLSNPPVLQTTALR